MSYSSPNAAKKLREFFHDLLRPQLIQEVCAWVEEHVEIPTGAKPGKVNLSETPYAREILDRFGDKATRNLVLCFGAQAAKTTIIMLGMLFRLCENPIDQAMWVLPNDDLAKSFSKTRWQKMVKMCKLAFDQVPRTPAGRIDKAMWGLVEQHFLQEVLNFVGSNSPANLSSRPCGVLVMDETDKYGQETKFEAGALQLAEERMKTYAFPFVVKASTPTVEGRMILDEYTKTDQRQYWVPCPRCEQKILLKFTIRSQEYGDCGIRWWYEDESEAKTDGLWDMAKVAKSTHYKCQCCGKIWKEYERETMIENGIWIPRNLLATAGHHGYHLSSLYSILSDQTSLPSIAIKFLTATTKSGKQGFINSWLAEGFEEAMLYTGKSIELEDYDESINLNSDEDGAVNIMGVDVQEDHFWVLVRRFFPPTEEKPYGHSFMLYADRVETEEEIDDLRELYRVDGEDVLCDMARNPNKVGVMIVKHNWRGAWGRDTRAYIHPGPGGTRVERIWSVAQYRDPHLGTKWANRTFDRARFVKFSKHDILDLTAALRWHRPGIWHTTLNAHPSYTDHMNSRVRTKRNNPRTGRAEWFWKELHQRNHLFDAENIVNVRALQLGLLVPPPETTMQDAVE